MWGKGPNKNSLLFTVKQCGRTVDILFFLCLYFFISVFYIERGEVVLVGTI